MPNKAAKLFSGTVRDESVVEEHIDSPFKRLPAETLLNILNRVDLINFPNLMIATYHHLRNHGIVPNYPSTMVHDVLLRLDPKDPEATCLGNLPPELLLAIGQSLTIQEKVHITLASHRYTDEEIYSITHMKAGSPKMSVKEVVKNKS
ncbi:MAG: hypothetical protein Q9174_001799 [Haloplaca sp. 1 TL-2023]